MKYWFTNGIEEIQIEDFSECPEGFHPGRRMKGKTLGKYSEERRRKISESCKGRVPPNKGKKEEIKHVYYTDGKVSIRIPVTQEPPPGFVRGRLKRKMTDEEKERFNTKIKTTKKERYGDEYYNNMPKTEATNIQKYGVACQLIRDDVYPTSTKDSKPNLEFMDLLQKNGITIDNREFVISGDRRRYDFRVGKTLIEINPSAWHSSTFSPLDGVEPKSKSYHYDKTITAVNNGYRCISVWDWDNKEMVVSLVKEKEIISSKNCDVHEVSIKEAKSFTSKNHLYGYVPSKIRVGLYYEDRLVSIMIFGKPRHDKRHQFELLRYCSTYNVVGGAEKIFKFFVSKYAPQSIVSYCDLSKFTGKVYYELGFNLEKVSIKRHWYHLKLGVHTTDSALRRNGFRCLFGKYFDVDDNNLPNMELMLKYGFIEVFDAGQATFSWKSHTSQ